MHLFVFVGQCIGSVFACLTHAFYVHSMASGYIIAVVEQNLYVVNL
jgi:hypothetical protein